MISGSDIQQEESAEEIEIDPVTKFEKEETSLKHKKIMSKYRTEYTGHSCSVSHE